MRSSAAILIFCFCTTFFNFVSLPALLAEDVKIKQEMHQAFVSFRELQKYLASDDKFEDEKNKEKVLGLITSLGSAFRDVKGASSHDYTDDPGFSASIEAILDVLEDAKNRYSDGEYKWAQYQLKNVTSNCITCHASYATDVKFYDSNDKVKSLGLAEQGEYFLATRQFENAKNAYYKLAMSVTEPYKRIDALQRWLLIYTRIDPNPNQIFNLLSAVSKKKDLYPYEKEVIGEWIESIAVWKATGTVSKEPVEAAAKLLGDAMDSREPLYTAVGTIELLRASSLLHSALKKDKLSKDKRMRALYMLGFTYTKLPGYFIHELPDIYLIRCIREFPNTDYAKKAYRLYTEMVRGEYTGSSGIHLPAELWAKFKELHDIAYGMPSNRL